MINRLMAFKAFRPQVNNLNYGYRMFSTQVPKVQFKFEDLEGREWSAEGLVGESVMEAGIMGGVPFEVACGGNAECCTCHVYLDLAVR
jgi:Na+-transporting NADH:ubiquinone oxidoreductase subunit NqrF